MKEPFMFFGCTTKHYLFIKIMFFNFSIVTDDSSFDKYSDDQFQKINTRYIIMVFENTNILPKISRFVFNTVPHM